MKQSAQKNTGNGAGVFGIQDVIVRRFNDRTNRRSDVVVVEGSMGVGQGGKHEPGDSMVVDVEQVHSKPDVVVGKPDVIRKSDAVLEHSKDAVQVGSMGVVLVHSKDAVQVGSRGVVLVHSKDAVQVGSMGVVLVLDNRMLAQVCCIRSCHRPQPSKALPKSLRLRTARLLNFSSVILLSQKR